MRKKIELKRQVNKKSFEEGYREFVLNCNIRNLSPYTIKHYDQIVHIWSKYFDVSMAICEINSVVVDNFILFLRNEMDENDTTMNTNIRGIRTVLYYFMKLGYLNEFKISKVQEVKEIIETYSDAEINILLRKPNLNKSTYLEYRNWVIINFLLASGCRARENIQINNDIIFLVHIRW